MPNATVLVVDDEPLIRWSLVNRLKEEGYRTLEAGTATDAVAQHREGADLILLDFALPDANGLAVLKQVKDTDPDTLVIMLTANTDVGTAVEAMKSGAFHYANKPFDLDEVDAAASRRRSRRRSCAAKCASFVRGRRSRTDHPASSATVRRSRRCGRYSRKSASARRQRCC